MIALGPPDGSARLILAARAVQLLRMAKASPSMEMVEKFRWSSCLTPSLSSAAASSRFVDSRFAGRLSSIATDSLICGVLLDAKLSLCQALERVREVLEMAKTANPTLVQDIGTPDTPQFLGGE